MINHPHRSKRAVSASPAPRKKPTLVRHDHDADYAALLEAVRTTFNRVRHLPLFRTTAEVWPLYLKNIDRSERQIHDCHTCRSFMKHYGDLAVITDDGRLISALWDPIDIPTFYHKASAAIALAIEQAGVIGPFLSAEAQWGQPHTDDWTHFSVTNAQRYHNLTITAGQAMAARRENFKDVERALFEFPRQHIREALRLLEADHLTRSEKFVAPLQWLEALQDRHAKARAVRQKANILWRAIAQAPEGYCHPRAGMTGSLLEDLAAGMSFAAVQKRWTDKMHPLQYQRPQAAPKAGTIVQAEKTFEQMGLARALERRYARLDEIELSWVPPRVKALRRSGLFGHLMTARSREYVAPTRGVPAATMTWDKFLRTVLPGAEDIRVDLVGSMPFIGLTTAVHDDAPPILKWDRDDERNPFAWYLYHNGSTPSDWGMNAGWAKVNAITQLPPMWGSVPQKHLGEGFILVLDGCRDQRNAGNALFPECLRNELHGVRSVIEADSRSRRMLGAAQASANGLDIRAGNKVINYRLKVTSGGVITEYRIDRWD